MSVKGSWKRRDTSKLPGAKPATYVFERDRTLSQYGKIIDVTDIVHDELKRLNKEEKKK